MHPHMKSPSPEALSLPSSQISLPEGGYFSGTHLGPSLSLSQHRSISPAQPVDKPLAVPANTTPNPTAKVDGELLTQLSAQNALIQALFNKVTDLETVLTQRLPLGVGSVSNASSHPHSASRLSSALQTRHASPVSEAEGQRTVSQPRPPHSPQSPRALPPPAAPPFVAAPAVQMPHMGAPLRQALPQPSQPLPGLVRNLTGLISKTLEGSGMEVSSEGPGGGVSGMAALRHQQRQLSGMAPQFTGMGVQQPGQPMPGMQLESLQAHINTLQQEAAVLIEATTPGASQLGPLGPGSDLEALSVMRKETWDSLENDVNAWKGKIESLCGLLDNMAAPSSRRSHVQPQPQHSTYLPHMQPQAPPQVHYQAPPHPMLGPGAPQIPDQAMSMGAGPPPPPPVPVPGSLSPPHTPVRDLAEPSEARERLQEHAERLTALLTHNEGMWPQEVLTSPEGVRQRAGELQDPEPEARPHRVVRKARQASAHADPRRPRRVSPPGKGARHRRVSPDSPPANRGHVGSEVSASPATSPRKSQPVRRPPPQSAAPKRAEAPAARPAASGPSFRPLAKPEQAPGQQQPPQERGTIVQQVHERLAYLSKQIGAPPPEPLQGKGQGQARHAEHGRVSPKRTRSQTRNGVLRVTDYASSDQLKRVQRFRERKTRGGRSDA